MPDNVNAGGGRPKIILETHHLVLRGAVITDVDDLFECFSDAEVLRYWDTLPHATPTITKTWVENMIQGPNNGVTDFVICSKPDTAQTQRNSTAFHTDQAQDFDVRQSDLKVIGKVGIWHGSEIGFLLNRSYWGRGLAVEAVSPVLDLAFDIQLLPPTKVVTDGASNSHRYNHTIVDAKTSIREDVVADVDPRNAASLGLLKKLGFKVYATKEKTFQVGEEWVDSVYLSLDRDTWIRTRNDLRIKCLLS